MPPYQLVQPFPQDTTNLRSALAEDKTSHRVAVIEPGAVQAGNPAQQSVHIAYHDRQASFGLVTYIQPNGESAVRLIDPRTNTLDVSIKPGTELSVIPAAELTKIPSVLKALGVKDVPESAQVLNNPEYNSADYYPTRQQKQVNDRVFPLSKAPTAEEIDKVSATQKLQAIHFAPVGTAPQIGIIAADEKKARELAADMAAKAQAPTLNIFLADHTPLNEQAVSGNLKGLGVQKADVKVEHISVHDAQPNKFNITIPTTPTLMESLGLNKTPPPVRLTAYNVDGGIGAHTVPSQPLTSQQVDITLASLGIHPGAPRKLEEGKPAPTVTLTFTRINENDPVQFEMVRKAVQDTIRAGYVPELKLTDKEGKPLADATAKYLNKCSADIKERYETLKSGGIESSASAVIPKTQTAQPVQLRPMHPITSDSLNKPLQQAGSSVKQEPDNSPPPGAQPPK